MSNRITRRSFVATSTTVTVGLAGCSGGAPPALGADVPEEPPDAAGPDFAAGTIDLEAFAWGVQSGDAIESAVVLSVRTFEPRVGLRFWIADGDGWQQGAHDEAHTPDEGVVQLELTSLPADTRCAFAFYSEDGTRRSIVGYFRTAPAPTTRRVIRFGVSCCLGGNEPWPVLTHAAGDTLDFFALLGDTVYADNGDNAYDYAAKWDAALRVAGLNDVTASASLVATWDDHEVENDWSLDTPDIGPQVEEARREFLRGLPIRLGPGGVIWRKLSYGQTLDVFVLDLHSERTGGNIVSAEQLQWLKDGLANSTAVFKVVLNPVPITDLSETIIGTLAANTRWQGYPTQRRELLEHVRDEAVTGLLWVTGDVHTGGTLLVDPPGGPGESHHEVIAGPAGSAISPVGFLLPGGQIVDIVPTWNYVRFECDPDAMTIVAVFIGNEGQVLAERTIDFA